MRKKRLIYNTVSSLGYEIIALICGLILPRLILLCYGSEINGLVYSVTQFLSLITLLDLGVGSVVQSALYKPLAEKNYAKINAVLTSAQQFFTRVAMIFLIYAVALAFIYPLFVGKHGYLTTFFLIAAIAINSFSQYYFGIVNKLLLQADQKNFIPAMIQCLTCILNTISCIICIKLKTPIYIVKLNTSLVFLLQPIIMAVYVRKNYPVNKKVILEREPLEQKWNGFSQHLASVIVGNTDTVILTIFSTLKNVSIYNTYFLVVNNVKALIIAFIRGMQSLIGDMLAKSEFEALNRVFSLYESVMHAGATFIFICTGILVTPFVSVYTQGVSDADYYVPLFGFLISFANMSHCYRLPYNTVIMAAGHYKQTQQSAWVEMIINFVVSISTVMRFGLVGVAIGTLCAMFYRTCYFALYLSKNILYRKMKIFMKHMCINIVTIALSVLICYYIDMNVSTYFEWFILSIKVVFVVAVITIVLNGLFYKDDFRAAIKSRRHN